MIAVSEPKTKKSYHSNTVPVAEAATTPSMDCLRGDAASAVVSVMRPPSPGTIGEFAARGSVVHAAAVAMTWARKRSRRADERQDFRAEENRSSTPFSKAV